MFELPRRVLFGAAYYHEYQPYERLKDDLDLMAEARFTVIRVGESVWSTWEPENGRFDLDWLQPVLDGAHERGISVILGTPTYAVPPWLARQYPEIAGESRTGERLGWGARQEVDFTHPAFRFHAERIIRKVVGRYADHPAVIGFQVDNEPGLHLFHNHGVFQRFTDELRERYGDVETLNREWGLVYWSHRLSTWADLWTPDGNAQPQYDLAWRRFQARLTTEFIAWQAEIVREYARPGQFVTTCISYDRQGVEDDRLTERLDVTAGNPYYTMQDALALPDVNGDGQHWTTNGTWALYRSADRMYSSRQEPYLVTETNAQAISGPWDNRPAYDGQWRQAAWALISRGASMIEYWHWHTLHFGTETYWGGILPHSGRPGRVYRELAALGAELERAGDLVSALTPDADVAFLYDGPSKWALKGQPPLADADGNPDGRSYETLFDAFYRGAFDAGLQARVLHPGQLADADLPPVLVVPGYYAADDSVLDRLRAYAEAGGHLVLGPRTGYGDTEARARTDLQPGRLAEAAGVTYDEFSNLRDPLPVTGTDALPLPADAHALHWADGLRPQGAETLAAYTHPHFGRWPAVTSHRHGAGRITYVGTVPDPVFARALFDRYAPDSAWRPAHPSVTATSATARDGRRVRFLHNWSWDEVSVPVPAAVRDVLSETVYGDTVPLGPWDVKVLQDDAL
ncbi:beta-galactosidase [Streptomyces purpurascens]|uniref:beta-galactosidase n=1 Tax=Streptomyces purpurascens TaxID=1924 RepID=UPI00167B8976|nr:beta-galactosidase [Streptomyces purpurascens]MCE7046008.1 beta-galactosidase [Streptomyces purpurascens]GGZ98064.1 beta-galactosidase [Streptomyces purpurascens]